MSTFALTIKLSHVLLFVAVQTALLKVGLQMRIREGMRGERIGVTTAGSGKTLKSDIETNSRIAISRHDTHIHTHIDMHTST